MAMESEISFSFMAMRTLGEPTVITQGKVNVDKKNPFEDILNAIFPLKENQAATSNLQ
jgi:hypothetical protein